MADLVDVRLPAEQAEGTESVVAVWFKAVGEAVVANEPLVEISTDKVTVELAAPASGVLQEILKQEGEQIELGEVIGRIAAGVTVGAAPAAAPPASAPSRPASATTGGADEDLSQELTPAVRRLLKQHGLSASAITGTGTGGRISMQDVEAYLADGSPAGPGPAGIPSRRVPHSQMRKSIAHHLAESVRAAPHVTTVFEVDLTAVQADRARRKADFQKQGARLTYTVYFVRATVEAIKVVPETNARWHPDALEIWEEINIGIGTALETGGLIVPVLRKAGDLDLLSTARAVGDLAERARTGALTPADVQGGTFTISNHGVSGSLVATPIIINQPQSAILGIGKLEDRAVVRDGQVVVRPMAYVTLTIDHRVLDGFSANAFLTRWVDVLEGWS